MNHLIQNTVKTIIYGIITILFIVSVGTTWLMTTRSGCEYAFKLAHEWLPGDWSIQSVNGRLVGPLTLRHVIWHTPEQSLSINKLQITWLPAQLLSGKLRIAELHIDQIGLLVFDNAPAEETEMTSQSIPSTLTLPLAVEINKLSVNQAQIKLPEQSPITFNDILLQGKVDSQGFHLLLKGQALAIQGLKSEFYLDGKPTAFNWFWTLNNQQDTQWRIEGTGDQQGVHWQTTQSDFLGGALSSQGQYQWQSALGNMQLKASHIELARINKNYDGNLNFALSGQSSEHTQQLRLTHLSGQLNQQPLSGESTLKWVNHQLASGSAKIILGQSQVNIDASLTQHRLKWHAHLANLQEIHPNITGTIDTDGQINDALFFGSLSAKDIHYRNKQWAKTLSIKANGRPELHRVNIQLDQNNAQWAANLTGGVKNLTWTGHLNLLSLTGKTTGNWHLKNQAQLMVNRTNFLIKNFYWASEEAFITANAQWEQTGNWSSNLNVHQLDLKKINRFTSPSVELSGKLNLTNSMTAKSYQITQADLDLNIAPYTILFFPITSNRALTFKSTHLQAKLGPEGLTSSAEMDFYQQPPLTATFNLPGYQGLDTPEDTQLIDAGIQWHPKNINFLDLFGLFKKPTGKFSTDLSVAGTWANPAVSGTIKIKNFNGTLVNPHIQLNDAEIILTGQDQSLLIHGQGESGEGDVNLNGILGIQNRKAEGKLSIKGNNFSLINSPTLGLTINPELNLTLHNQRMDLNGVITLPKATLKFQDFSSAITLSDDVVFVDNDNSSSASNQPLPNQSQISFYSNILLKLGDEIELNSYGLKGKLSGELKLTSSPKHPTLASGQLKIRDGSYAAYAQNLDIISGILNFTNTPIDQPWLSLRASRQIKITQQKHCDVDDTCHNQPNTEKTVTVGVQLDGPIDHLKRNYFSDPAGELNQTRILSYLILGFDLNQPNGMGGSSHNKQTMITALASLNSESGQGIGSIMENFRNLLNLNELSLGTSNNPYATDEADADQTSLRLGKRLSKHLYVNWSLGIEDPVQIVTLRYSFGRHWSLQTEATYGMNGTGSSSTAGGGDLFYHF